VLTWPWLGPEFFLLYLLVQSLSPFTSLSILLYSETPLSVVNILTLVLVWKQDTSFFPFPARPRFLGRRLFLSCPLGGTWDNLFLSFAGWPRVYIVSSHHLSCSRRVSRSDQSCLNASGPTSSLDIRFSIAELMKKTCLYWRLELIFMVDSAFLHPYTLFCSSSFSTWSPYVHAFWG